jgi:hypothetical protein
MNRLLGCKTKEVLDTELSVLTATAVLQRVTLITSAIATGNELRKLVANIHSANWDLAITVGAPQEPLRL